MTPPDTTPHPFEPRAPWLVALIVFAVAALAIFHPMLAGQFLAGDDQAIAGYGFRLFGAEFHQQTGRIPQWNPYIFGGLPFFAVIGHGDIFYPTAWLRWFVPTDVGMTIGFFVHYVIAGAGAYALLRGFRASWGGAVIGGLAYEFTGIVAGTISPGHDGKLFVAALAPFALLALLRASRERRLDRLGLFALLIGLAVLTPQTQVAYYLMIACGFFTLWLAFADPERPTGRSPWAFVGMAFVAVALGGGVAMIQVLPIMSYLPWTSRADGVGWDYATSYAFPPLEVMTTILPQFNGVMEHYWGSNFFKSHTEYVGAVVLMLAAIGVGRAKERKLLLPLLLIGGFFLLVSFGGHTPFYLAWYHFPMVKSFRATGMAFYLVGLVIAVFAGLGADRLLAGQARAKTLYVVAGAFGLLALLAAGGVLQGVTESLARGIASAPRSSPRVIDAAIANAPELRAGGLRLLLAVLLGGGVLLLVQRAVLRGAAAIALIAAVLVADNWSVLKRFAHWWPPAATSFADDELVTAMRKTPMPFRALDPGGMAGGGGVYQGSVLMAHRVPNLLGYHGFESRFFDSTWGGKNQWSQQFSPSLHDLWAVKYLLLNQELPAEITGFHKVMGPTAFANLNGKRAQAGYLYERDSAATWVRVVPGAAKAPEAQLAATVADPRFPTSRVVLLPDTASVTVAPLAGLPEPATVTARLAAWEPGKMTVAFDGRDARTTWLVVAENWYPDWRATVDGTPAAVHRGNNAMVTVEIPSGAKQVELVFDMASYRTGRMITMVSVVLALGVVVVGRRRKVADG